MGGQPSDDPDASRGWRRIFIVLGFLVLCAALLLAWFYIPRSPGGYSVEWQSTTVPYDPECKQGCKVIGYVSPGHHGEPVPVSVNPDVDDPLAQWGGCIDSFTRCMDEKKDTLSCMQQSSCPGDCKTAYKDAAADKTELKDQLALFREMFLEEGAFCRPAEEAS